MKRLAIVIVLGVLATGGIFYFAQDGGGASRVRFRTARVERGEVVEGVEASGTIQPEVLVQVGTQISGVIDKIFVDFNSKVTKGQTIALIDARRLEAQVAQDTAALARAKADVERVRAQLVKAEKDLARARALAERRLVGEAELDAAIAEVDALRAQIAVGEAAVAQAQAQLDGDRVNLAFTKIVSPTSGVVVARNVDVGQTVAASLQAPTLFVIANDLTKVQVQTSVPEADIGRIHEGQAARFTVDAHPDRTFSGVVSQVRLASTSVQNVVTYPVVIEASNPHGLLLPGMTANVTFEVAKSPPDALRVPSSALRLKPAVDLVEGAAATGSGAVVAEERELQPRGERRPEDGSKAHGERQGGGRPSFVYVRATETLLRAIPVRAGISDGTLTAVEPLRPDALKEGMEVVTAIVREEDETATQNPFAPPRIGGRGAGAFGGRR